MSNTYRHVKLASRRVALFDGKNHLSEYLRRVQAGEDIIVTSQGKRVGRLSAVGEPPPEDDPEGVAIARLRAQPVDPARERQPRIGRSHHPAAKGGKTAFTVGDRGSKVILYSDTSAVITLYVDEPQAAEVRYI
jgi:antitoxin (DNA-binding transcriptional repressor) of toxin-antitoxin stability system